MLLGPMQARFRAWMDGTFVDREIILRVDGHLRCFTFTRRQQIRFVSAGLAVCAWALLGTAAFVVDQIRVARLAGDVENARLAAAAADDAAAQAQSAGDRLRAENAVLRAELAEDGRQFASLVRQIDPLGLIGGAALHGSRADAYELARLADALRHSTTAYREMIAHVALRERARGLADQLGRVVGLHFAFTHEIVGLRAQIATAQAERQHLAATLDHVGGLLRQTREEADRSAERVAFLEGAIAGLRTQLATAERLNDELLADSRRIEAELSADRVMRAASDLAPGRAVDYPMRKLWAGNAPEDALVLAVMRHESAFRVDAVSPAGALGLMQIMPDTAAYVAARLKIGYEPSRLLGDPDFNITIGRAYLDHLLRLFDGSYVLAIAAYNAGPNRVLEWIERFGDPRRNGVDTGAWIDSIPFAETRIYVRRVLRSLDLYRQRLAEAAPDQCTGARAGRALVYASQ